MSMPRSPFRKRLAHGLKRAWHACGPIDAWVDDALEAAAGEESPEAKTLGARARLRLFPERRLRASPFVADQSGSGRAGLVRMLALVPPEDSGGGSRPAQLAAEFHRRGFAIEWRWALPIYPWPRRRRPAIAGVDARPWHEIPSSQRRADLVLLEAPHPRLGEIALATPRHGPIVYEAIDLWDGELGVDWYDPACERAWIERADALTASSLLLRDQLAASSGRPVDLLPNAIDLASFRDHATTAPALTRGAPTIIFVGALWGAWVDLDLLSELARRLPEAALHLVGPSGDRVLPRAANIHIHGPRPRNEIPGLLAAADVAVIPFAPGRLSEAVSPLKVFEYLAMGRPVVSTPLPDLDGMPGVRLAQTPDAFACAVEEAAHAAFPSAAVEDFLQEHTWARRVDRLLEIAGHASARRAEKP